MAEEQGKEKNQDEVEKPEDFLKATFIQQLFYARLVEIHGSQAKVAENTGINPSNISKAFRGDGSNKMSLNEVIQSLTGNKDESFYNEDKSALTNYGKKIVGCSIKIFQEFENLLLEIKKRPLRVGASAVFPRYLCLEILKPLITGDNLKGLVTTDNPCEFEFFPLEFSDSKLKENISHKNIDVVLGDGENPVGLWKKQKTMNLQAHLVVVAHKNLIKKIKDKKFAKTKNHKWPDFENWPNDVPFIVPSEDIGSHFSFKRINKWFEKHEWEPKILVHTVDRLLYVMFAREGLAAVVLPSVVSAEICNDHDLIEIGQIDDKEDNFFITTPKNLSDYYPNIDLVFNRLEELGGVYQKSD